MRLIDTDALTFTGLDFLKIYDEKMSENNGFKNCSASFTALAFFKAGTSGAYRTVDEAPTVEAAPVVHGRWTDNKHDTPICSNCGKEDIPSMDGGGCFYRPPFCPFCGAKMDLEG